MVKRTAEDEEEAFPRGRPGAAAAAPDAPAGGGAPAAKRGKGDDGRKKDRRKKAEQAEEEAEAGEEGVEALPQAPRSAPRLRHSDLADGTLLVAAVRDVSDEELTLNLPFNLVGHCPAAQAFEASAADGELPKLTKLYRPGQLVVAVVSAVVEAPGKGSRQRVEVSLRPALANAGLDTESLTQAMWLPAVVEGEEEHVLRLGFGLKGIQGVLQRSEISGMHCKPCLGMIIQVAVQAVSSKGTVKVTMKASQSMGHAALPMNLLKAGFLVHARIDKILASPAKGDDGTANGGLVVSFCGALPGVVHVHHQGEMPQFKMKQRVTARILAVVPGQQTVVHLTLLPHLLDWAHKPEALTAVEVGDRLQGETIDSLQKYGLRLRCTPEKAEAAAPKKGAASFACFCPSSKLSDKDAGDGADKGAKLPCRVLAHNFLDFCLVVTRRPDDLKKDCLVSVSELAPGQIVAGDITRISEYGVFVKLSEYVTGLVHLRHLTDVPLAAVPKKFQEGGRLKCRVLRVNAGKRQVGLTCKKSLVKSDFQLTEFAQAQRNMLITGYVSKVQDYGAIVAFFGNVHGLIPAKEMGQELAPALGMAVKCRIQSVNQKRQRIGLTLDLEGGTAAAEVAASGGQGVEDAAAAPGDVASSVRAVRCTAEGVLLRFAPRRGESGEAGEELWGFAPLAHLADDLTLAKARHAALAKELGGVADTLDPAEEEADAKGKALQEEGVVLASRWSPKRTAATEENRDLTYFVLVTLKPSLRLSASEGAFVTDFEKLQASRLYTGYVKEVRDFGVLVSVGAWRLSGIAPKHQIAEHFVEKPSEELTPGQSVRVFISQITEASQRFTADLRPLAPSPADAPLLRREAEALKLYFAARGAVGAAGKKKGAGAAATAEALAPGAVLDAVVSSIKPYGALFTLKDYDGLTALALKENMPESSAAKLKEGKAVKCAVLDFDRASGIADVSLQPELLAASAEKSMADLLTVGAATKKKHKFAGNAPGSDPGAGKQVKTVQVMPALQKGAYSVVWCKEPPCVLFAPPFGEKSWTAPRTAIVHCASAEAAQGGEPVRVLVRCPHGGVEVKNKGKVPKILRPGEELQVGSPIKMRVLATHGLQILCAAPVDVKGHVHATQLDDGGALGDAPRTPLDTLPEKGAIVEARILQITQHGNSKKGSKEWHLELTMKPSFVSEVRETADYEAAAVKWSTLKKGRQLSAVVVEVQRTGIWLEVAPGLKGHVALLDASTDLEVLNDLPAHFKFGQVYETEVLDVNRAQKRLDLTLQKGGSSPSAGSTTLARLHQIGDVAGKGIAATFQLPGRCHAFAHVTELFDFWAAFPLKRLKPHKVYEAFVVRKAGEKDDPDAKFELSLRSSVVHGQKEGPEEMRPLQATDLKAGQIVSGYVVNAGPKGVFLALSRSLVARIRLKALSDALVSKEKVAKLYPPGTLIQTAKVVEVDTENSRVELSLRVGDSRGRLTVEQLSVGDIVSGRVKRVEKYGLFMRLDNSIVDGLVYRAEVSDSASASLDSYKPGTPIPHAKVLKLENNKVWLGIKPSLFDEDELGDDDNDNDEDDDLLNQLAEEAEGAEEAEPAEERPKKKAKTQVEKVTAAFEASTKAKPNVKAKAPDSDDEAAPWDLAAASEKHKETGFEFADFKVAADSDSEDGEENEDEDDEDDGSKRPSKRQKKAQKAAANKELQELEAENADGRRATDPKSVEDFERMLLTQGDTSIVWIKYMAFHLKMSDLERARQVAERAVKHVGFAEAKERFNVWVAFMNLECTFGTEKSADDVFKRASSYNNAKHVHLQLARIHDRNKKPELATKVHEACCRKFPHSKKVWLALLGFLYRQGDLEGGRKTLPRCLSALPRKKHPVVVSKAALLEYHHGSQERGRSIFEGLLDNYPKRTDLWSVFLDAHIAANTPPRVSAADLKEVRTLLERCCTMKLKAAKMRFFFKRWLDFEKRWGDTESQELVRGKAREFVESQAV